MKKRLTTHQIIDETVEYYKNNPRAKQRTWCEYLTDDGKMCAVGRCLTPKSLEIVHKEYEGKSISDIPSFKLKSRYEGHSVTFWFCLQSFHDCDHCWDGNKLTEDGERRVKVLKEKFVNI